MHQAVPCIEKQRESPYKRDRISIQFFVSKYFLLRSDTYFMKHDFVKHNNSRGSLRSSPKGKLATINISLIRNNSPDSAWLLIAKHGGKIWNEC